MGFSLDFSGMDEKQVKDVLLTGQEVIRMILENDPNTDTELARTLWDKAHTKV